MNIAGAIHERRDEILRVAASHGAGNIRLFGSAVRGEDTPNSDIGLLVDVTGSQARGFPEASRPSWKNSWANGCRWLFADP